eukprot:TRINITY_DN10909_c0_g1_i1.p1 TRINITY_DN10909_c0_g1~~TRINITY_DN10909_c0_g1_i1.p1  ORF type:complete len:587 (+),score=81.23 TRINITY_DN10909_c0_g1_i1:157-1917(+)
MPRVYSGDNAVRKRTGDVGASEPCSFADLRLSAPILRGLESAGYVNPSPIQLAAIPLGRFGVDLIAQAKSGTGKTCVFSVIALEALDLDLELPQVLVIAPTREIALQIQSVICEIGKFLVSSSNKPLSCHAFIGGMSVSRDKQHAQHCHVVVGTPGRLQALVQSHGLLINSIRLLIADEADKLLDSSFNGFLESVLTSMPARKQVIALSATFPPAQRALLIKHMRNPKFILLNPEAPSLMGVRQFYVDIVQHGHSLQVQLQKLQVVVHTLNSVRFYQCIIFCNNRSLSRRLVDTLNDSGWPSALICGTMLQSERNAAIRALRSFELRVLVSSDLTARGLDIDRINLVINADMPQDAETYMHRVGRTGRFGSYGIAVSLLLPDELAWLTQKAAEFEFEFEQLPEEIPDELYAYELESTEDQTAMKKLELIHQAALLTREQNLQNVQHEEDEQSQQPLHKEEQVRTEDAGVQPAATEPCFSEASQMIATYTSTQSHHGYPQPSWNHSQDSSQHYEVSKPQYCYNHELQHGRACNNFQVPLHASPHPQLRAQQYWSSHYVSLPRPQFVSQPSFVVPGGKPNHDYCQYHR